MTQTTITNLLIGAGQCYFTTPYLPSNFPPRVDELLIALFPNRVAVYVQLPLHMVFHRRVVIYFEDYQAISLNPLYLVVDSVTFLTLLVIIDPTDTAAELSTTIFNISRMHSQSYIYRQMHNIPAIHYDLDLNDPSTFDLPVTVAFLACAD